MKMRTLADKNSFTSNAEIRAKINFTNNPVTRSVYKEIIKHRAIYAIEKQPYYNNKNKPYGNTKTLGSSDPNNKKV